MKAHKRSAKGNISEFGAALVVLICAVILPLLNFSFVPVRYMICQGAMSELVRRLAHADKLSEARELMKKEQFWIAFLGQCGVTTENEKLALIVTTSDGSKGFVVDEGKKVPDEWLPGGSNGPCIYSLSLTADCTISALCAGMFQPAKVTVAARTQWENLSKDPRSMTYFVNE